MSNIKTLGVVPASLIAVLGTGVDTIGILGKKIRTVADAPIDPFASLFQENPKPDYLKGAEGTVIHVDAQGGIWVDFGDNERVRTRKTPEGEECRIHDVGNVDEANKDWFKLYELAE